MRTAFSCLPSCLAMSPNVKPSERKLTTSQSSSNNSAPWLYKFASQTKLTPETFLTAPIWHPCTGNPAALIKERGGE
jgi:hypothetical protein